jgi:hypothetical protein
MSSELQRRWSLIMKHLGADSYLSINSTYEQEISTTISEVTGLPIYSRKAERLRWLNAAVVDIDRHHDPQFSFEIRSVWRGRIGEPKNSRSKAAVPLIPQLEALLERHREASGNPASGPIFPNGAGQGPRP